MEMNENHNSKGQNLKKKRKRKRKIGGKDAESFKYFKLCNMNIQDVVSLYFVFFNNGALNYVSVVEANSNIV